MSRILVDSGINWIGLLPNTWSITTVNKIFYRRKEVNDKENPTVLSLARDGVKIRDISNNEGQLAESYDNYHKVYKDDLMINPMDLISGANCSLSEVEGVISPAYINLAKKENIYPKYYDYFFKYQYWINAMFIHGKGVSFDNRWTMNWETMSSYKLPLPRFDEQKKIANYLNKQCSKIDNIIQDNNKEIELLEEYKSNLINEKLESIKETVNVKLKYFIQIKSGSNINYSLNEGSYSVYGGGKLLGYADKYNVLENQLLVGRVGANCGQITYTGRKCYATDNALIISTTLEPKYTMYLLKKLNLNSLNESNAQPLVTATKIYDLKTRICVDKEIENEVVNYLDKQCSKIDEVIEYRKQIIEKLEEYKKSLIYECVTGKREV